MGTLFISLRRNRRLLKDLLVRDLKGRYVGSVMGFFWSIIFPAVSLLIYMFVFRLVLKARWYDQQGQFEVGLLMLVGIVVWQAYSESVLRMTNSLVENRNLIQKVVFPAEILPTYLTLSSLTNMLIGVGVALAGVAYAAWIKDAGGDVARPLGFGASLVCLPLLIALQSLFMLGVGSFLAAFNLILRDTHHVIGVLLQVWMFATPIFYPDHLVQKAGFGWLLRFNPMYGLVEAYRAIMVYGNWPQWREVGIFALVSVAVLFLGMRFFLWQKPRFPDLL